MKGLALSVDLSNRIINDPEELKKILETKDYLAFLSFLHINNTYLEEYIETFSLFTKIINYPKEKEFVIFIGIKKDMKNKVMILSEIDNLISKENKLKTQEKIKELGLEYIPLILTVCDEPYGNNNPKASKDIFSLTKKNKI